MRCRPGDLCFITRTPPQAADLLGRVVKVLTCNDGGDWTIEEPLRYVARCQGIAWSIIGGRYVQIEKGDVGKVVRIHDENLTPIRPGDESEPTATTTPAPDERAVLLPQVA